MLSLARMVWAEGRCAPGLSIPGKGGLQGVAEHCGGE